MLAVVKLFFKNCESKPHEQTKELISPLAAILDWYADEMAESVEIYELLNFYSGIVKNFEEFKYEGLIKLMNSGFLEELLPVHAQVLLAIFLTM